MQKIRAVAEGHDISAEQDNLIPDSLIALLERPWFRRVWVLQEVAAAQHVLLVCGASQIDGYAFCLGLAPYMDTSEGLEYVSSVEYLIRGSIFRPKYTKTDSGLITLGIRSLGELMDMYHAHDATEPLDKVFALLGMSTDGLSASELRPNYSISWDALFCQLMTFLLGPKVSVKTSNSNRAAVISGQGTIIGKVTSVAPRSNRNRDFQVTLKFMKPYQSFWSSTAWNLHAGVKRAKEGDLLCLIEGASNPMLIRQEENCFSVIMISVPPTSRETKLLQTSTLHKLILVWNLEDSKKTTQDSQLRTWLDTATLEYVEPHPEKVVQNGHLLVVSAHALVGASQFVAAINLFRKAVKCYDYHLAADDRNKIECLAATAVAYGSLGQWPEAKGIWEFIIGACYSSSDFFTQATDFLDRLIPVIRQDENDYDGKKWQAVRDAPKAKRSQAPLPEDQFLHLIEYLDSEVMNILVDQQDPWPVPMEKTLIAAARNENGGEAVLKVFLDRLSDVEITEQGQDAQITEAVFRSAAANSKSYRTIIFSLLRHKGIEVCSEIHTDQMRLLLSVFMVDYYPFDWERELLYLAKLYSKADNTTLLRLLISATGPLGIPFLRRELYLFAWDEHKFRRLDELVQILPPALDDVIATLTHILLSNGAHAVKRVIEVAHRQRLDATNIDTVNEEVVNGCCKIIENRSPAELLQFLDSLHELGISFRCQGEIESPPTQSAILPATVSKDPRFLKILTEKNVVSPQMRPFTIFSERRSGYERHGAIQERYPPAGMPDWPLYSQVPVSTKAILVPVQVEQKPR
ncbi:het-domain-containing protein [Fusarium mundagurra]|uniref:Het-domain-containing protein n=1 Tax=Fusarium mundagurra TaxID=1567541 RepID=A0A8H6DHF6_9HYPO|nr:het-domain-containing protein [Fusarium mundagurra]